MKSKSNIDFIGIGYAKSGTSYVFKHLNSHPEISLPEIKELRYFNESWFLPKSSAFNKLFSSHWHFKQYRNRLKKSIRYWLKNPTHFRHDNWNRKYLFGRHTDTWYNELFDPNKISGEITPAYVFMPEEQIRDLSLRFPHLKIIVMLRHPVDRTWSQVKMNLAKHKGRKVSDISQKDIDDRMKALLELTPLYSQSIPLWKKYFSNVFVGFHDDIIARPAGLMHDLFQFLGASDLDLKDSAIAKKVNVGLKGETPAREKAFLESHFRAEIELLKETTNWPYVEDW